MSRVTGLLLTLTLLCAACGSGTFHHSLIGDPTPVGEVTPSTAAAATTVLGTVAPATTTAAPTTTVAVAPTTTAAPARPPRPYAVGTTTLDLTDPSRTTVFRPGRHLPTVVSYPIAGAAGAGETPNAPGLFHGWPLVVFAHGYNATPTTYHDLVHHLAAAGFVVAAPAFPLELAGGPLDEADLQNEPGDIKFVITSVLAASNHLGTLAGMVDPTRIALVGHSDGAEAVLGTAFLPGVADARVGPVVAMSAQAILNGDHVATSGRAHPLLVVQGTADTIIRPALGDALFAGAPAPKAELRLLGGGHLPPVADDTPWRPIVEAVTVDWLDAWFGGPNAVGVAARLGHDGDVAGLSTVQLG